MVSKSHRSFPNLQHELLKFIIVTGGLLLPSQPVRPPWRHFGGARALCRTIASNVPFIIASVAANAGYRPSRHGAEVMPVTGLATIIAGLALIVAEGSVHDIE